MDLTRLLCLCANICCDEDGAGCELTSCSEKKVEMCDEMHENVVPVGPAHGQCQPVPCIKADNQLCNPCRPHTSVVYLELNSELRGKGGPKNISEVDSNEINPPLAGMQRMVLLATSRLVSGH